jgi:hypothetical protein
VRWNEALRFFGFDLLMAAVVLRLGASSDILDMLHDYPNLSAYIARHCQNNCRAPTLDEERRMIYAALSSRHSARAVARFSLKFSRR